MSSREKQLCVLLFLIMADCDLVIVGQTCWGRGACIDFRPILTAVLKDSRQGRGDVRPSGGHALMSGPRPGRTLALKCLLPLHFRGVLANMWVD